MHSEHGGRELMRRVRRWLRWRQLDDDLAEEMGFHRAMTQERLEAGGMTPDAASAATGRAFGSRALAADRARDVWMPAWAQDTARDVRFALRMLVRDRSFTLVVVAVLGLGIGTASVQSVLVDAVCIRGLPIPGVDRVLFFGAKDSADRDVALSYREFDRLRTAARDVTDVSAFASAPAVLGDDDRAPDRALVTYGSSTLFRLLREAPHLGRVFEPADDRPGAAPVAILAAGMWRSRYAGDPAVVGRTVRVNGTPATIVGVMREPFRFPSVTDVWMPLSSMAGIATERRTARALTVVGRMNDAAALAGVRSQMAAEAARLAHDYPATNAGIALDAKPINERYNGRLTDAVWIAFALVAVIVLLIACANAANMLLLRAAARSHEIAVRASLGASRWRIVRQLLVESALLAALGGLLGAALAAFALRGINALIPENTLAYWMRFRLDLRGLALLCGVCAATVMVFGLAPALHVARTDVTDAIKSGGRGGFGVVRGRRWTALCLAAECGLTMVMLAGLVVSVRTTLDAGRQFVAVKPDGVLTTWVTLPADRYSTVDARRAFYREIEMRVSQIAGTSAVAMATALPLGGATPRTLAIDDRAPAADRTAPTAWTVTVSPRYFDAVGIALTRGRAFGDRDGLRGYETAVVNQPFADEFFRGEDAIGRRIRLTEPDVPAADAVPLTIVGIVPPVRQRVTSADPDPVVYLPLAAAPPASAVLFVRGPSSAATAAGPLREALRGVDPELPMYRTMPMSDALDGVQWNGRVSEWLLYSITVVAVALASLGLYAVIAHAIVQRSREIGIRVALGATRRRIVSMVLRQATLHFALGSTAGVLCVLAFARLTSGDGSVRAAGYQITSPSTLLLVGLVLALITLAASVAPAWRACRLDPARTLREN
jgi:putative ABC transport system permease protein